MTLKIKTVRHFKNKINDFGNFPRSICTHSLICARLVLETRVLRYRKSFHFSVFNVKRR